MLGATFALPPHVQADDAGEDTLEAVAETVEDETTNEDAPDKVEDEAAGWFIADRVQPGGG